MQYTASTSTGNSVAFAVETLPQAFASIADPRRKQGTRYSVAPSLSLAVVALLANQNSSPRRLARAVVVAERKLAQRSWAGRAVRRVWG